MKAIILCGGEGSRLRPLTCDIPKPLTRLCGRPVLSYTLDALVKVNVTEAVLTVKYLADDIIGYFEENPRDDIKLSFIREDTPLGTAGSVSNCRDLVSDGDFLVVSGDALFDFDLNSAVDFHKSTRSVATIVTTKVDDPREYGTVITSTDGRIERFCEKPDWSQAVSNMANTGIYILNPSVFRLIPENTPFDFAKDLFPKMLFCKHRLYAFGTEGYWCDIGNIESYKKCQFDILTGKVKNAPESNTNKGVFCRDNELPQGDYTLVPPVYIGSNVSIGKGAVIGPEAVIDDNCAIGLGTTVKKSVLLENAYVGSNCELRGTLLCKNSCVESTGRMYEGSVLGSRSKVGIGARIGTNVKIWPEKLAENGACVNSNIKWGTAFAGIFDEDGITGECGADITPELCAKAGQALATVTKRGRIAVCHDGQLPSRIHCDALISGIASCGAEAVCIGTGWDTLLSRFVKLMGFDGGVFIDSAGNKISMRICGKDGLNLTRDEERKFDQIIRNCDFARCGFDEYREIQSFDGAKTVIINDLRNRFEHAKLPPCHVDCCCEPMQSFADELFKALKIPHGELKFHIAFSGHSLAAIDENNEFISAPRMNLIICEAILAGGEDVAVTCDAPKVLENMAQKHQRSVLRYPVCPNGDSDISARELSSRQGYLNDAFLGMLKVLSYMATSNKTLSEINKEIPSQSYLNRDITLHSAVQNAISVLKEKFGGSFESDGIRIFYRETDVYCRPSKRGNSIKVCVRASDMETAEEFCKKIEKSL